MHKPERAPRAAPAQTKPGVVVLVGDTTCIVSTKHRWGEPQVADAQLMMAAETIVGRL